MTFDEQFFFVLNLYLLSVPISLVMYLVIVKVEDGFVKVKVLIEVLFYSFVPVAGFVVACIAFGSMVSFHAKRLKFMEKKVF